MLFNSIHFLFFFPAVVALFFALPHRHRWKLLLAASYYFYACWKVEYLVLIIFSTCLDYFCGRAMGAREEQKARRPFLYLSLAGNLGLLFSFKYFNFVNESLRTAFNQFNILYDVPAFNVLLPVGISFYTFQTIGYAIDVYRGDKEAETRFGIFALYVSFFPQLVAGPIERSQRLLPQLGDRVVEWDARRISSGLRIILWGFFLKVVLADNVGDYGRIVSSDVDSYSGFPMLFTMYFFLWRFFGDFAGYSLIAIGTARILGYDLMENFRRPFFSVNFAELWRRWHISLMSWFRDYMYRPLGGMKKGRARGYWNLFLVFFVSGIWHGATWNYVVWGALQGIVVVLGAMTLMWRNGLWKRLDQFQRRNERVAAAGIVLPLAKIRKVFQVVLVFHLFGITCIPVGCNNIRDSWVFFKNLFVLQPGTHTGILIPGVGMIDFILMAGLVVVVFSLQFFEEYTRQRWEPALARAARPLRWATYVLLILSILLLGDFGAEEFIYFQF